MTNPELKAVAREYLWRLFNLQVVAVSKADIMMADIAIKILDLRDDPVSEAHL